MLTANHTQMISAKHMTYKGSRCDHLAMGQRKNAKRKAVKKNKAAAALGRKGGLKAASTMTKRQKIERGKKGATARWKKEKGEDYEIDCTSGAVKKGDAA
jgi:hypothetical protein